MQEAAGFCEPVTRAFGIRVRTAAGNSVEITHDGTNGRIRCSSGSLVLEGTGIETAAVISAGALVASGDIGSTGDITAALKVIASDGIFDGATRIPAPSTGTTAARPVSPVLAQEYFDTDLDSWIKWNGSEWRYLTEAAV